MDLLRLDAVGIVSDEEEPKQRTPKDLEIPVPKRDEVLGLLRKAAKPTPPSADDAKK